MIKRYFFCLTLLYFLVSCNISRYKFQYLCLDNGKTITKIYQNGLNAELTDYFVVGYYNKQKLPESYLSVSYSGRGGYDLFIVSEGDSCVIYRMNGEIFNGSNDKLRLHEELSYDASQKLWDKLKTETNCAIIHVMDYSHSDINQQNCQCENDD